MVKHGTCLRNYREFGIGKVDAGTAKSGKAHRGKTVSELGWCIEILKLYPLGLGGLSRVSEFLHSPDAYSLRVSVGFYLLQVCAGALNSSSGGWETQDQGAGVAGSFCGLFPWLSGGHLLSSGGDLVDQGKALPPLPHCCCHCWSEPGPFTAMLRPFAGAWALTLQLLQLCLKGSPEDIHSN